ncbi:MAG: hypothetical protein JST84_04415 [Acidobacteria bacterium]|nr:hypothetical protein [Acidobacteriota bacterium]
MSTEQSDLHVDVYSHLDRLDNELRALREKLDHGEAVSTGQLEELKRALSNIRMVSSGPGNTSEMAW